MSDQKKSKELIESGEMLDRISDNVESVIVVKKDGTKIKTPVQINDQKLTPMAGDVASLAAKAYSVCRELDPQDDLVSVRIRTARNELLVTQGVAEDFLLVALQDITKKKGGH